MAVVNTYDYVAPNFNDVTTHKANLFPQSVGGDFNLFLINNYDYAYSDLNTCVL